MSSGENDADDLSRGVRKKGEGLLEVVIDIPKDLELIMDVYSVPSPPSNSFVVLRSFE